MVDCLPFLIRKDIICWENSIIPFITWFNSYGVGGEEGACFSLGYSQGYFCSSLTGLVPLLDFFNFFLGLRLWDRIYLLDLINQLFNIQNFLAK